MVIRISSFCWKADNSPWSKQTQAQDAAIAVDGKLTQISGGLEKLRQAWQMYKKGNYTYTAQLRVVY